MNMTKSLDEVYFLIRTLKQISLILVGEFFITINFKNEVEPLLR